MNTLLDSNALEGSREKNGPVVEENAGQSLDRANCFFRAVCAVGSRASIIEAKRLLELLVWASELRGAKDCPRFSDGGLLRSSTNALHNTVAHPISAVVPR